MTTDSTEYSIVKISEESIFFCYTYEFTLATLTGQSETTRIRMYIPDFNQLFSSSKFVIPLISKFNLSPEYYRSIALLLNFHLITNYSSNSARERKNIKRFRHLNMDTLKYNGTIKELLANRSRQYNKEAVDDIIYQITHELPSLHMEDLRDVAQRALYKMPTPKKLTDFGTFAHMQRAIKKFGKYYHNLFINKVDLLNTANFKDIMSFLDEEPGLSDIRGAKLENILRLVSEELDKLELTFTFLPPEVTVGTSDDGKIIGLDLDKLDFIYKSIMEYLQECKKEFKDKDKIRTIDLCCREIKRNYESPYQDKFWTYIIINDWLQPKDEVPYYLSSVLDTLLQNCYNAWAHQIFNELNANEKLSKIERRLFILMNFSLKSLFHKIPILEPAYLNFLNYSQFIEPLIIFGILFRKDIAFEPVVLNYLYGEFLSYLKFRSWWDDNLKLNEYESHAQKQYNTRRVRIQDKDEIDYSRAQRQNKSLDYEDDNKETISEQPESEDGSETDIESLPEQQFPESDDTKIKIEPETIHPSGVLNVDLERIDLKSHGMLYIKDILSTHFSEDDYNFIMKLVYEDKPVKTLAFELGISEAAISKRKNILFKKASKISALRDIMIHI